MREFVLATANPDKVDEVRAVLAGADLTLVARPSSVPEVDETEDTLEGNAMLKARALSTATGLSAIADDTGLFVDALDGRPGVHSARFAGETASYEDNVRKLLGELRGVAPRDRTARFRTVIAVVEPDAEPWWVEGVLEGTILEEPRGHGGFGFDPVFQPIGETRSLAELTASEKNASSHRGLALRRVAERLHD